MLSGQARLVRATAEGGGGIHLIHGLSSSDSDDDEDFGDDFPCCDVPSPPGTLRAKSYFISYNIIHSGGLVVNAEGPFFTISQF